MSCVWIIVGCSLRSTGPHSALEQCTSNCKLELIPYISRPWPVTGHSTREEQHFGRTACHLAMPQTESRPRRGSFGRPKAADSDDTKSAGYLREHGHLGVQHRIHRKWWLSGRSTGPLSALGQDAGQPFQPLPSRM